MAGGAVGLRAPGYVRGRPEGGCRVPVGLASAVKLPDRAALHGVLAEIEALGLELLEVRRLPPA